MERRVRSRRDGINAARDPVIKVIPTGKPADGDGIFAGFHGKRLTLAERSRIFVVEDGSAAGQNSDVAAVVEIVDAERGLAPSDDREVATRHAEVVTARGIYIEGSGTLAKDKPSGSGSIVERKIVKLENRIFVQKSHCAIFKFNFGAAVVGSKNVTLAEGEIGFRFFPNGFLIGERVAMSVSSETHVTLHKAEANDAGMAGIGESGADAQRESEEQGERKEETKRAAGSHVSPPSGTQANLLNVRRTAGGIGCARVTVMQSSRRRQSASRD